MINKPLVDFIRKEIVLGKDKETIKSSLMSEGNWSQEDVQTAYRRAARVNIRNEFLTDMGLFTLISTILLLLAFFSGNEKWMWAFAFYGFSGSMILFFFLRQLAHQVFLKKRVNYSSLITVPLSMFIGTVIGLFIGTASKVGVVFLFGPLTGTLVGFKVGDWLSTRFFKK